MTDIQVVHDPAHRRYRASIDGEAAGFAEYILTDELIVFTHTDVDRRFEGKGVGSALARFALDEVRSAGQRRVMPLCPFIKDWIGRHREYVSMVYGVPESTAKDRHGSKAATRRDNPMTKTLTDKSGATVKVELEIGGQVSSYTVSLDDGSTVGRANFVDSTGTGHDRIFFHTEVDEAFGGRGLAGLLVREALDDSIRKNVTVVAVCPVFARHLKLHGIEFTARGGVFRRPTPADFALVTRAARGRA